MKVRKSRLFTLKVVIVCLTNSLFNRTRKSAFKTRHTLQFNNVIRLLFQKKLDVFLKDCFEKQRTI